MELGLDMQAKLTNFSRVEKMQIGWRFSKRRRHDVLLVLLFWLGALDWNFYSVALIFSSAIFRFSVHKSKQPTSEDTSFPGLFFTKSEGKQPVCYLKLPALIIMPTLKIAWTAMRYFCSNTSQSAIKVSFAVSLRLCTPFREVNIQLRHTLTLVPQI